MHFTIIWSRSINQPDSTFITQDGFEGLRMSFTVSIPAHTCTRAHTHRVIDLLSRLPITVVISKLQTCRRQLVLCPVSQSLHIVLVSWKNRESMANLYFKNSD